MQGTVVSISVTAGDAVRAGTPVLVIEAMKMEHVITADVGGTVRSISAVVGATVYPGDALVVVEEGAADAHETIATEAVDLDAIRPDLAEVLRRQSLTRDEERPAAVARRRKVGLRTARENLADLCDPDSFEEYGSLVIAAQRSRRSVQELIEQTPADGLVGGIGRVNGGRCAVVSYDYTVLAGTQGQRNHAKKDRLFELVERLRLPVVLFAEGGGGRPGDTDASGVSGLECMAFALFARLSGLVPLIGVVSGRCFAGNAALLGCCDVIIATEDSNIGMGGPAMIEGGGLGTYAPEDVGPISVQAPNGVVDVIVTDDVEAVRVAKQYLSYFQERVGVVGVRRPAAAAFGDPREPTARVRRARRHRHDVRHRIGARAPAAVRRGDRDRVGAHRRTTARHHRQQPRAPRRRHRQRRRRQGRAVHAVVRCVRSADPVSVRHAGVHGRAGSREDRAGAALQPHVRRRRQHDRAVLHDHPAQGLRARRAVDGRRQLPRRSSPWRGRPASSAAWGSKVPCSSGSGASSTPSRIPTRARPSTSGWWRAYENGKALNTATYFEIDDVIDPLDSRRRIVNALRAAPPLPHRDGKKRPFIDTW